MAEEEQPQLPAFRAALGEDDQGLDGVAAADDETLMRFLRARKGDIEAAVAQYRRTQQWRAEVDAAQYTRDIDVEGTVAGARRPERNARSPGGGGDGDGGGGDGGGGTRPAPIALDVDGVEVLPSLRMVAPDRDEWAYRTFCAHANFGHDKGGRPIYLERTGATARRLKRLVKAVGKDGVIRRHIRQQELALVRMRASAVARGLPVTQQVLIFDMAGLSFWPEPIGFAIFKEVLRIDADYYPEVLHRQFLINCPFIFGAIWKLVKTWLDPVTAQKIQVLGSDYRSKLLEAIDADQLPVEYGGTSTFVLEQPCDDEAEGRHLQSEIERARAALGVPESSGGGGAGDEDAGAAVAAAEST